MICFAKYLLDSNETIKALKIPKKLNNLKNHILSENANPAYTWEFDCEPCKMSANLAATLQEISEMNVANLNSKTTRALQAPSMLDQ